jgi:hypothetical protein
MAQTGSRVDLPHGAVSEYAAEPSSPDMGASQLSGQHMLVHTLVCEQHLWFAVPCLRSLRAYSEDPVRLVLHDDGSLTQVSVALLAAAFPDSILVPRRSADAELADSLAQLPHLAQARLHLPHVMKLFDVAFTHPEPILRYVDTDVLFQRRFRGLFPFSRPSASGAFMTDSRSCFGAHPGDFWPLGPLRLSRRLNSGLFWIQRDRIDYDRMEYLFKRWGPQRIRKYHGWFEQTVWADQAWRARCSMFDPAQFGMPTHADSSSRKLTGVHFVTPTRTMLAVALQSAPSASAENSSGDIEDIRLCPSKTYGLSAAMFDAARAIGTLASSGNSRFARVISREKN